MGGAHPHFTVAVKIMCGIKCPLPRGPLVGVNALCQCLLLQRPPLHCLLGLHAKAFHKAHLYLSQADPELLKGMAVLALIPSLHQSLAQSRCFVDVSTELNWVSLWSGGCDLQWVPSLSRARSGPACGQVAVVLSGRRSLCTVSSVSPGRLDAVCW
jgi:hypothetical protein